MDTQKGKMKMEFWDKWKSWTLGGKEELDDRGKSG